MHSETQKISVKEKIGFSLGDGAANLIFQTMMLLQLSFYTDTFGLTAGAAAALFLIARLWGAVADPIMGAIGDRTKTRWGKFRPWVLWTAVPFGIVGYLAFTTPDFGTSGKLVYAYITYLLLMTVYSANNIPYSALSGVITGDMEQRTSLSSFRFVLVVLATLAIQGFALPMVNHFGQGDSAKGYQITMGIFSAIAVLFFIITFATTKERIKPAPQQKTSLKQDITDLFTNRQWMIMFFVFVFMFIFLAIRNGILLYFFKYYLDVESQRAFLEGLDKGLFGLLGSTGMTAASADIAGNTFSVINILSQIASLLGIALSKPLATKFGKRDAFRTWLIISGIFAALFIIAPPTGILLTCILSILFNFAWGVTMPLPWAMMADVADYGEWKTKRRATGIVFAGVVIGLKVGLAIGGFLAGQLLSLYGYVSNVAQSAGALRGIRLTVSIYPVIALVLCVIALFIYGINRKVEYQMQDELAERRKNYE
ncbi:MAG: MFS transporter [Bacteroidales bacterium]|nr:MFS transporter [Bacteroidales bacterium]